MTCKLCIKWDVFFIMLRHKQTIGSEQTLAYWVNVEQIQWVAGWRAWTWDHPFKQTQQPWPRGHTASSRSFNNLLYKKISILLTLVVEYLVVCKCPHDNKILKFAEIICWEFWQSRTSFVNLVCRIPNSFGQTNIRSIVPYLTNWKQTVSSIVSENPVSYKLVFLLVVQGLEHSVIKKSNSLAIDLL